jgi:hypothetical protein
MLHELFPSGKIDALCSANRNRFDLFVSHHGASAESAGARPGLLDGGREAPVFTC